MDILWICQRSFVLFFFSFRVRGTRIRNDFFRIRLEIRQKVSDPTGHWLMKQSDAWEQYFLTSFLCLSAPWWRGSKSFGSGSGSGSATLIKSMGALLSNVFPVCHSSMMARLQFISLWTAAKHRQGWKKPGFKKKNPAQWVLWVFWGFFFCFFFFYLPRRERTF